MQFAPGQRVFDRYVVEAFLGDGPTGEVYRARHERLGHRVALKMLSEPFDDRLGARFGRAARLLARIRHPSVVGVVDYGLISDRIPCLVTEFAPGYSLRQILSRRGALPWEEAVKLVLGVLNGVSAIHAHSVLHRNLKPGNVIVTPGHPEQIRIVDLLFATATDAEGDTAITAEGESVGAPAYASPEQIMGRPLDARSDVYSVGLILYELVTGSSPRDARNMKAALESLDFTLEAPIAPTPLPPLPGPLTDALDAALAPDPQERPDSARLFARQLRTIRRALAPDASPEVVPGPPVAQTGVAAPPAGADQTTPAASAPAPAAAPVSATASPGSPPGLRAVTSPGVDMTAIRERLRAGRSGTGTDPNLALPISVGPSGVANAPLSRPLSQPGVLLRPTTRPGTQGRTTSPGRADESPWAEVRASAPGSAMSRPFVAGAGGARPVSRPVQPERMPARPMPSGPSSEEPSPQPSVPPPVLTRMRTQPGLRMQTNPGTALHATHPSVAAEGQIRVRGVMAARLPASELGNPEVRRWLRALIAELGVSFQLGAQFWVGVMRAPSDEEMRQLAASVLDTIRSRFDGVGGRVEWTPVDEHFDLTTASARGIAPPPLEILELLELVSDE